MRQFTKFALLALILASCAAPEATPAPARRSEGAAAHLLVALQGSLSVKREGWRAYAPAAFGMALHSGDLLRLDGPAQATVACADLTLATVPGGMGGVPCKVAGKPLTYGGSLVNPTRADPSGQFPQVLAPRKTRLLNPLPTLRWAPVAGATSYTVSVRGGGVDWSTEVSGKTEVAYPEGAPKLAPGGTYKVTVAAGGHSSDEETAPGLGFTLCTAEEAQAVRQAEAKVGAMGLPAGPMGFLTANTYAAQGLYAEAIEQLEGLAVGFPEPAVWRSLGEWYLAVGLTTPAEARYAEALRLSEAAGDTEGQALAQAQLGLIDQALGNTDGAAARLKAAADLYGTLGDAQKVKDLEAQMGK